MIEHLIKSMMPKELLEHRDKVESGNIIGDYIRIQRKESNLSRTQRDRIVAKFNNYKKRKFYSEKELEKIDLKIAE